jgi:hypothetical protein
VSGQERHTVDNDAPDPAEALRRLADQAYNTAGDSDGRARVMEDFRMVAEALQARVTPPDVP